MTKFNNLHPHHQRWIKEASGKVPSGFVAVIWRDTGGDGTWEVQLPGDHLCIGKLLRSADMAHGWAERLVESSAQFEWCCDGQPFAADGRFFVLGNDDVLTELIPRKV